MSKPSDAPRGRRLAAATGILLVSCAAVLLQLPLGASAGIAAGANDAAPPPAASPVLPVSPRTLNNYQLRCWQYGRLLFDESAVSLPADARVGARLVAFDRHGAPLIVTDAGGATCLARAAGAAPSAALPR